MTWRPTEPAGSTSIPIGAQYIRENWVQIQSVLTSTRLSAGTEIEDLIPAGSVIWFYADTAPTGYTILAGSSDELLAVKGGSTFTTGAAQAGTWTQDGHALTSSETATHTHATNALTSANSGGGSTIYCYASSNPQTGSALSGGSSGSDPGWHLSSGSGKFECSPRTE